MTGAGVVIQALVLPQAAGVLFSRHPHAGDPSHVIITANYGLGEVSLKKIGINKYPNYTKIFRNYL